MHIHHIMVTFGNIIKYVMEIFQSDILLNTRMNTLPNVASMFGKLQSPIGSSIIGDHESSEASRTKVTSNQRSSVYIGQVVRET